MPRKLMFWFDFDYNDYEKVFKEDPSKIREVATPFGVEIEDVEYPGPAGGNPCIHGLAHSKDAARRFMEAFFAKAGLVMSIAGTEHIDQVENFIRFVTDRMVEV